MDFLQREQESVLEVMNNRWGLTSDSFQPVLRTGLELAPVFAFAGLGRVSSIQLAAMEESHRYISTSRFQEEANASLPGA